jgi:hypothetical protein
MIIATVISLTWCSGMSWVTHEIFLDLIRTSGIIAAWTLSAFMGIMNLLTSLLLFAFIMTTKDFR